MGIRQTSPFYIKLLERNTDLIELAFLFNLKNLRLKIISFLLLLLNLKFFANIKATT
jgi:hypothetical protein